MKIYSGIDLVEISRVKNAITRHPRMKQRFFTAGECTHAEGRGKFAYASYAGIFAAKEAVVKALRVGFTIGKWQEVEIIWEDAAPGVCLFGAFSDCAALLGIHDMSLSISHDRFYAIAMVTLIGGKHAVGNNG